MNGTSKCEKCARTGIGRAPFNGAMTAERNAFIMIYIECERM